MAHNTYVCAFCLGLVGPGSQLYAQLPDVTKVCLQLAEAAGDATTPAAQPLSTAGKGKFWEELNDAERAAAELLGWSEDFAARVAWVAGKGATFLGSSYPWPWARSLFSPMSCVAILRTLSAS